MLQLDGLERHHLAVEAAGGASLDGWWSTRDAFDAALLPDSSDLSDEDRQERRALGLEV